LLQRVGVGVLAFVVRVASAEESSEEVPRARIARILLDPRLKRRENRVLRIDAAGKRGALRVARARRGVLRAFHARVLERGEVVLGRRAFLDSRERRAVRSFEPSGESPFAVGFRELEEDRVPTLVELDRDPIVIEAQASANVARENELAVHPRVNALVARDGERRRALRVGAHERQREREALVLGLEERVEDEDPRDRAHEKRSAASLAILAGIRAVEIDSGFGRLRAPERRAALVLERADHAPALEVAERLPDLSPRIGRACLRDDTPTQKTA